MKPARFPEAQKNLNAPEGLPDEAGGPIGPLPVWTDGRQCVSLWRPSLRERLSVLLFGRVWVAVLFGATQPPIALDARRSYFRHEVQEV